VRVVWAILFAAWLEKRTRFRLPPARNIFGGATFGTPPSFLN
jgi:hypothetical protein